jgi:probable rRNA maturation factor
MKDLNLRYRALDMTTDVLSFPQIESSARYSALSNQHFILGDIVINLHQAKRQAVEHDLTLNEELERLLIHGLTHLIGYDHGKSRYLENKMESKERELLNALRKDLPISS